MFLGKTCQKNEGAVVIRMDQSCAVCVSKLRWHGGDMRHAFRTRVAGKADVKRAFLARRDATYSQHRRPLFADGWWAFGLWCVVCIEGVVIFSDVSAGGPLFRTERYNKLVRSREPLPDDHHRVHPRPLQVPSTYLRIGGTCVRLVEVGHFIDT